ncbi:BF3164 family lipoprotein [Natronoflexus pectinivorans]|uniref:TolB-like protein n=1 Tax=Natronoflexus pectinivorans TaxID=682526 RepID=A0A4R2G965_9BACT|nr:BF3164 family lipoprotein [Natronoflexus pectinivorans]TCO04435.1 TolB-like protein [Natronoflexus pectinivorans]
MKTLSFALIYLIFNTLIFHACSRHEEMSHTDFPIEKNILFEEHKISALLGTPMDMVIMNDYVIVLDGTTDMFFHIFSKDNFNYSGSIIRKGGGPNEEYVIFPYFKKIGKNMILYQSADNLKIIEINRSNDFLDIAPNKRYHLPTSSLSDVDFFLINDQIFSSSSQRISSKDYSVINKETGDSFEWGGSVPLLNERVDPQFIPMINQKLTTVNIEKNLIASVYNMLPLLRIYSLDNEIPLIELKMADATINRQIFLKDLDLGGSKQPINYYHRIKSTDEYIYALYGGFSVSEYFKEGEMPHVFDFSKEIHIWEWDGTPVMKLKLDRPVFSFDVTHDNKKIIATSVVDVEKLFVTEIPWQ